MANPDDLHDFTFETHNPQYPSYGSRLSWPLQPPPPASPAQPTSTVAKRSTSPLPLSLETSAFAQQHQPHAPSYASGGMSMADWARVAATKEPLTYPPSLQSASFAQPPFESFGNSTFQASPTDYMPAPDMQTGGMETNVGGNGMPMDASFVNVGMNMGPVHSISNMNLGSLGQMDQGGLPAGLETMSNLSGWSDVGTMGNMYNVEELQRMLSMQPQQSQGSHHAAAATNGGGYAMPVSSEYNSSDGGNEYEVRSLSSSDNGYVLVNDPTAQHSPPLHGGAIFNPGETLHPRTSSQSSCSDEHHHASFDGSCGSASDAPPPSAGSPSATSAIFHSDWHSDAEHYYDYERPSPPMAVLTPAPPAPPLPSQHLMRPLETHHPRSTAATAGSTSASSAITSPQRSPTSPASRKPPKKPTLTKSSSVGKAPRRASLVAGAKTGVGLAVADAEKKVGRRKGPLRPDQRKQASEIRKLGACIRCRFLKKVCDKGEPCGGCQPSHARLWLVPCTRVDIKDLNYFMKDWTADYSRHVSLGFSVGNIKGFSDKERTLFVTHGYGHCLPVQAREVFVRDERVFGVDWVEVRAGRRSEHEVHTARMSAGLEGISAAMLSDYLDRHIDGGFEFFVDEFFEGTPFVTDILKTVHRFWERERVPVLRKALKLVLAYTLTQAVCLVKLLGSDEDAGFEGRIDDADSYWQGQTVAPVMINFQVKCALAEMWRELQKEILDELSGLFSSIYSKDKLKHWPTIFMLASVLLLVWELMQFDCRYRVPDAAAVDKFCADMEATPVGVIVGLFAAISQKVPAFAEWETPKHHAHLGSNPAVCAAMEEVRDHVRRHDKYLRERPQAAFDRNDFDCLSNKFVSKLVIRAH